MGGNVAWTLRLEDGTEYRMSRWTNIFAHATINEPFLRGEPDAIQESLEEWFQMKKDWEDNKKTKNYNFPMTDCYSPYPFGLKPIEYGIIVTDFVNKVIISNQGYTDLCAKYVSRNAEQLRTKVAKDVLSLDQLQQYLDSGRLKGYEMLVNNQHVYVTDCSDKTAEIIMNDLETLRGLSIIYISPPAPWVVHDYFMQDKQGRIQTYDMVKSLGFSISPSEQRRWNAWIRTGS